MSDQKWQPCPFCGSGESLIMQAELGLYCVHCLECGCRGPTHEKRKIAEVEWDVRNSVPSKCCVTI